MTAYWRDKVRAYLPGYVGTCDHGDDVFSAMKVAGVPYASLTEETFYCPDGGPAVPCRVDDLGYVLALDDGRVLS